MAKFDSLDHAVRAFREASDAKAEAVSAREDKRRFRDMSQAVSYLYSQGQEGRSRFAALLEDPSPNVRCWVAAQLLAEGNNKAEHVLQELSNQKWPVGFDAEITLEEHRKNRLQSPFGIEVTDA
jgi:hypothetical protein